MCLYDNDHLTIHCAFRLTRRLLRSWLVDEKGRTSTFPSLSWHLPFSFISYSMPISRILHIYLQLVLRSLYFSLSTQFKARRTIASHHFAHPRRAALQHHHIPRGEASKCAFRRKCLRMHLAPTLLPRLPHSLGLSTLRVPQSINVLQADDLFAHGNLPLGMAGRSLSELDRLLGRLDLLPQHLALLLGRLLRFLGVPELVQRRDGQALLDRRVRRRNDVLDHVPLGLGGDEARHDGDHVARAERVVGVVDQVLFWVVEVLDEQKKRRRRLALLLS